ncbi:MAG: DUF2298 domain-containing protein, partial [Chloroflexota bacterium]
MELTPIFIWWLIITIFGLVGWPLAFSWLRYLPDRGFAFIRPVGLLITGYILWLGGTLRLLPNSLGGVVFAALLVVGLGFIWQRQQARSASDITILEWVKQEWRYILSVELLFNVAFVGWTIFKAYNPDIETVGGEKWMEIAFINANLQSDYFPPQDPWLSGFGISYYYFGYVLLAMTTRLSGIVSTTAFNLYTPTLFALTLTTAFGVIANLVTLHRLSFRADESTDSNLTISILKSPAIFAGFVSALFVGILGNLEGLLEAIHKRGLLPDGFWVWLDIRNLKEPPQEITDTFIPDRFHWWWRASRVLTDYNLTGGEQEVIDEFPFFSFLLGDVHPHVLALPFVLLVVALALNLIANPNFALTLFKEQQTINEPSTIFDRLQQILERGWIDLNEAIGGRLALLLYTIAIGALSFLNTWDFPIYLGVIGLALISWLAQRYGSWQAALQPGMIGIGALGFLSVVLYFPFYATFQSQAGGILPNLWNPTRLPQFFVFFGPFLVATIFLLIVLAGRQSGWGRYVGNSIGFTVFGPVILMLLILTVTLIAPSGRSYIEGILRNTEIQQFLGVSTVGDLIQAAMGRRLSDPWTCLFLG